MDKLWIICEIFYYNNLSIFIEYAIKASEHLQYQEVPDLDARTGTSFINSKTVAYYSDYIPSIAAGVMPKTLQSIRAIFNDGSACFEVQKKKFYDSTCQKFHTSKVFPITPDC